MRRTHYNWPVALVAGIVATVGMLPRSAARSATPAPAFEDVTDAVGIGFRHVSPLSESRHIHLTMGSGVAWSDFDRDGWPDLYFGQGREWSPRSPGPGAPVPTDALYRNAAGKFLDVTDSARIANAEYAMGLAVGDIDNDGFPDIYVSNFGPNRLFRNNGDGTFDEVAGVDHPGYGASCTFADTDGDGDFDLYVVNYVQIDRANYRVCSETYRGNTLHIACPPWQYQPEPDVLYRNNGDGSFTDISQEAGLRDFDPKAGLGVVACDLDTDGDLDFYVANDSDPNFLLVNDGIGRFTEIGLISGTALNRHGMREAGMGVAVGDVDGDGRFDLFKTNFYGETNTLYRNLAPGLYLDVTEDIGLAAPSRTRLGFGTLMIDADNDTWLDLFVANGHIHDRLPELGRDHPFRQRPQLMWNRGGKRFEDASDSAGDYFQGAYVGRGCAAADYDRDGRIDVAVQHLNGPAALLQNTTNSDNHALCLELIGTHGSRDAIGARVEVEIDERRVVRLREGSTSYLSCSEGRLLVGIGAARSARRVTVRWPGGRGEVWENVPAYGTRRLIEGTGRPL